MHKSHYSRMRITFSYSWLLLFGYMRSIGTFRCARTAKGWRTLADGVWLHCPLLFFYFLTVLSLVLFCKQLSIWVIRHSFMVYRVQWNILYIKNINELTIVFMLEAPKSNVIWETSGTSFYYLFLFLFLTIWIFSSLFFSVILTWCCLFLKHNSTYFDLFVHKWFL